MQAQMATAPSKPTFEQWRLLALLVAAVFVNYIDRSNLSVSATDIKQEFGLTAAQLGLASSWFFASYALCQLAAGWVFERYSVYFVLGMGFVLWSLATAATGLVSTFALLIATRVVLGIGESVAYPAFSKILASDFGETQRGTANALIDAGSKLGPAIGTYFGALVVASQGWRSLFIYLGFGAMIWLPFWVIWTPRGRRLPAPSPNTKVSVRMPSMLELLSLRSVWGSFLGLFAINYTWYFMVTWFPYYLENVRHFSKQSMATLGAIPFLMIAIGATLAGVLADRMIAKGASPTRTRKTFIVTGLLCNTLLLPAFLAPSNEIAMGLFWLASFAFGLTTANHWAVTQTIAGPVVAGKWTGMQNCFGNFAGVLAGWLTGKIIDVTGSFQMAFAVVVGMVIMGALSYAFLVGRIEPHDWNRQGSVT
ncbi:MAG: MFS transporter [Bryobacteraceae bacterium]|nr:MFS transporter [Bryobacteraceae bacterium]